MISNKQRKIDARNFAIHARSTEIREAIFLLNKAANRLRCINRYYDCSKDPDFDDLNHNVYSAIQFLDFAYEELEEIADRDHVETLNKLRRKIMGGERETTVEKKEPKAKGGKADFGNFRIHQKDTEVHIHDDTAKLKAAVPVLAWWKMWDRLRNEPGTWTWLDPSNKTRLTVETALDQDVLGVKVSLAPITINADWDKINNFTKRK